MQYWEIIADKPSNAIGVGAACQPWTRTGKRSLLQTGMAPEKRFVVRADEKLTAFLELARAIQRIE